MPKNNLPLEELPLVPSIEGLELPKPPFSFNDSRVTGERSAWQEALTKLVQGEVTQQEYDAVEGYID